MNKSLLIGIFLLLFLIPALVFAQQDCPDSGDPQATGIVPCGVSCSCTISNVFTMLGRIYDFLVKMIAIPLAVLGILIGGIMILISGGNPNLAGNGKKVLYSSVIGLFLVFSSWLIIDFIMKAVGWSHGNWWEL
jgi:hypothetical protein